MKVYLVWENDWCQGIIFHGLFKNYEEAEKHRDNLISQYEEDEGYEIFIENLFCPL